MSCQEGVQLYGVHVVRIVAQQACQFDFTYFVQLFRRELRWPALILVPESVAITNERKLFTNDAGESWSHHGPEQWVLRYARTPRIDVVHTLVHVHVAQYGHIVDQTIQILETFHSLQSTVFSDVIVTGHSHFSSTGNVDGCQVGTKMVARLLKQMVGHFGGHHGVHTVRWLVNEPEYEGVEHARLVQFVRLTHQGGQSNRFWGNKMISLSQKALQVKRTNLLVILAVSVNRVWDDCVPESECCSVKLDANARVHLVVVARVIAVLLQADTLLVH